MINNFIKKAFLAVGIALFSVFDVFAQDTLAYKYVCHYADRVYTCCDMIRYPAEDSTFIIEGGGLFASPSDTSPYRYQFKVENDQWLMKYEADWKVFFNRKEESVGSWKMRFFRDLLDMNIRWEKTNIVDDTDTVYAFALQPAPIHLEDGGLRMIETSDYSYYYFTFSAGVIAIKSDGGWGRLFIRDDKLHLQNRLEWYRPKKLFKN